MMRYRLARIVPGLNRPWGTSTARGPEAWSGVCSRVGSAEGSTSAAPQPAQNRLVSAFGLEQAGQFTGLLHREVLDWRRYQSRRPVVARRAWAREEVVVRGNESLHSSQVCLPGAPFGYMQERPETRVNQRWSSISLRVQRGDVGICGGGEAVDPRHEPSGHIVDFRSVGLQAFDGGLVQVVPKVDDLIL